MKAREIALGCFFALIFVSGIYGMYRFESDKPILTYNLTIPSYDSATHYRARCEYDGEGGSLIIFTTKISPLNEELTFSTRYSHIKQLYCMIIYYKAAGDGYEIIDTVFKTYQINNGGAA